MKKTILFFAVAAIVSISFSACKKDKAEATTTQKIQTKWNFESEFYHSVQPGLPEYRDTLVGLVGEYADFRTDNKVYSYIDGYYDTTTYSIVGDTKIVIDGDTNTIQTLNESKFTIYRKDITSTADYTELTINLKK
jgi:hypothetical protein